MNWDNTLPRVQEASAQENSQNLMQALIQEGGLVIEAVEQPEPPAERAHLESGSSQSLPQEESKSPQV